MGYAQCAAGRLGFDELSKVVDLTFILYDE
jgi:hypothetical protein